MRIQGTSTYYQPRTFTQRPAAPVAAGGGEFAPAPTSVQMAPMSGSLLGMSHLIGNEQDLARLNRWGLASEGMLRFAAGGNIRRSIASFLTGIPNQKLLMYGQMADMLRIKGVDPDSAHLLVLAGVRSPMELARYAGDNVVSKVQRGIVWAGMAAQAANTALSAGRTYQVPSMDQLQLFANNSTGVGSSIDYGSISQSQPSSGLLT